MIRLTKFFAMAAMLLSIPAGASTVLWQTRHIGSPITLTSAAAYKNDISALMAMPATTGYGNVSPVSYNNLNNQQFFGSNSNIAFQTTLSFNAPTAGVWDFRFGVDYGLGGAVYIDGVNKAFRTDDLWWGGNWSDGDVINIHTSLTQGNHVVVLYGIEGCCDGGQSGQFRFNGGAWTTFGANDGHNVKKAPEPGALGLLGAGLLGLAFSRRRKRAA